MQTPGREARIARLLVRNRDGELQDGADMAGGGLRLVLKNPEPVSVIEVLDRAGEVEALHVGGIAPIVFRRNAVDEFQDARDIEGEMAEFLDPFQEFLISGMEGCHGLVRDAGVPGLRFDAGPLHKAVLVRLLRSGTLAEEAGFNCGQAGEGALPGLLLSKDFVVVGFGLFVEAQECALGGGFVAAEVRVEALLGICPTIGVAREIEFHLFEAMTSAFQKPVGARGLFDQGDGDFVIGLVEFEPAIDEGVEFGRVFVAENGFFGAAAVLDGIFAGAGFAAGSAGAGLFR